MKKLLSKIAYGVCLFAIAVAALWAVLTDCPDIVAFRDGILDIADRAWERGRYALRTALLITTIFPILSIWWGVWHLPTLAAITILLPIVGMFAILWEYPSVWIGIWGVGAISRQFGRGLILQRLAIILGIELLIGLYASVVPIWTDWKLVLTLIVAVFAAAFMSGAGYPKIARYLVLFGLGITVTFFFFAAKEQFTTKFPKMTTEAKTIPDTVDERGAARIKNWRTATPSPTPTPGAAGPSYEDKARWPICMEVGLIDRSWAKAGHTERVAVHYHDCFYRVRMPASSYWNLRPIRPVPFCQRYVYTGERKSQLRCGIGDEADTEADMNRDIGSQMVEFTSDADVQLSVFSINS